jgi:hypothetical protein
LYKHDVCKPDYVDHGMDKIEDPRLKSMILSPLTNTDSRWIIAYTRYTRCSPHYLRLGILMNAYTAGNLPDRDLHEFSKFPDDMKIRILERLTVMVSYLYSMKIYRLDRMMLWQRYEICILLDSKESGSHGRHLDRQPKALIIEEVYRSGVTAMKCHLKDRMPRSNGVVKNSASYKTFSDEIKDSEAGAEGYLSIQTSSGSFSRCLDNNATKLYDV